MNSVDTVKAYNEAMESKDMTRVRELLADDFSFAGPMMTVEGADAFVEFMSGGPFEASQETIQFVANGNSVAHVFLFRMTAPETAEIRMCEILGVTGGKIDSSQLFFDTAKFPASLGGGQS